MSVLRQILHVYFNEIEGVEFVNDSRGPQIFLSSLYMYVCMDMCT